ncbi:lipoyl protein ligase domain-containing protein [Pseudarthrobacter sp. NPDC092419]|uniref:lipoyl protein ligase domain-containing protein n=1 Tax=Pseudarthrobacter sp. NPDC092419 TaxID=3364414 RepID=UPI0038086AD7
MRRREDRDRAESGSRNGVNGVHPPFGPGPFRLVHDPKPRSGPDDMEFIAGRLGGLPSAPGGELNFSRPRPTAAFSRRDSLRPGYPAARDLLAARGYEPIIRPVGGHLALYGSGDLVVHLWAPHADPRSSIKERFDSFGRNTAAALRGLGADARVGAVPGEYCTGEFSVNDAGRAKLAGTGQRLTRHGYLFSAVVMVEEAGPARAALEEAYALLDLDFRPESVGCVADAVPGTTVDDVREALAHRLMPVLQAAQPLDPQPPFALSGATRVH